MKKGNEMGNRNLVGKISKEDIREWVQVVSGWSMIIWIACELLEKLLGEKEKRR